MTNLKSTGKIESLLAKRAALDARIERLKQRSTADDRKARSRALLLLGVATEKQIHAHPGAVHMVRQMIASHLKDREQAVVTSYLFSAGPDPSTPESDTLDSQSAVASGRAI